MSRMAVSYPTTKEEPGKRAAFPEKRGSPVTTTMSPETSRKVGPSKRFGQGVASSGCSPAWRSFQVGECGKDGAAATVPRWECGAPNSNLGGMSTRPLLVPGGDFPMVAALTSLSKLKHPPCQLPHRYPPLVCIQCCDLIAGHTLRDHPATQAERTSSTRRGQCPQE